MKETIKIILLSLTLLLTLSACKTSQTANDKTNKWVNIETKYGNITLRLYDETPQHRDNFVKLVKEGFYNGTLFHRVIRNFMIQGGDPDSKGAPAGKLLGNGDLGYTIEAEIREGLYHKRGALAAARTGDNINPERRSSAAQFYIVWGKTFDDNELRKEMNRVAKSMGMAPGSITLNAEQRRIYTTIGGTPHLDGQYTVFGEVVEGLDVVEKIQTANTDLANRPVDDIGMKVSLVAPIKKSTKRKKKK